MSVIVGWHIVKFCKFPRIIKFKHWTFGLGCVHFDYYTIEDVSPELRSEKYTF